MFRILRRLLNVAAFWLGAVATLAVAEAVDYSQFRHWSGLIPWSGEATTVERFEILGHEYCLAAGPQQGCVVYDLDDPTRPTAVGSVHVLGPETDAVVRGWFAYVTTGSLGLSSVIVADPTSPNEVASVDLPGEAVRVAVAADHAYVACGDAGLAVVQLPEGGQLWHQNTFTAVGGVGAVVAQDGLVYAGLVVGGLAVLDVTDPGAPALIGQWNGTSQFSDLVATGSRIFGATHVGSSVVELDISDPSHPVQVNQTTGVGLNHGKLSLVGGEVLLTGEGGVAAVDATDPAALPIVFTRRFDAHAQDVAGGEGWLIVASDRGLETFSGAAPGPPPPYVSLPNAATERLIRSGDTLIACSADGLDLYDVSDPTQAGLITAFELPGSVGWELVGDILWVCRGYYDPGLTAVDISDPALPIVRSHVDASMRAGCFTVYDGHAYLPIHSGGFELSVFDIGDPDAPVAVGSFAVGYRLRELVAHRGYLFGRVHGWTLLSVFDASEPRHPVPVDSFGFFGIGRLSLDGDRMLVGNHDDQRSLDLYDMTDPLAPLRVGSVPDLPGPCYSSRLVGDLVFVAPAGVIVDVSEPDDSRMVGSFGRESVSNPMLDVVVDGDAMCYGLHHGPVFVAPSPLTTVTAVTEPAAARPAAALAVTAAPNPFNPRVTIAYDLPRDGDVTIDILDVRGRHVRRLSVGSRPAGHHAVVWNGEDDAGRPQSTGVYLARVATAGTEVVTKLALVR